MGRDQVSEPWFCYLLRCADGSFYVGITNDLEERVRKHNQGLGPRFTKLRRPVELIWSELRADRFAARQRDIELKGWSRAKKMKLLAAAKAEAAQGNPSPAAQAQGKGE